MKVRFNHWYHAVLTTLLAMLGFSCDGLDSEEPVMYGALTPHFYINGTVTDQTGTPIEGIKTSLKQVTKSDDFTHVSNLDSMQTNEMGLYEFQCTPWSILRDVKLIVEDIDGEAHGGEFLSDTLDVDFDKAELKKGVKNSLDVQYYQIKQDIKMMRKPEK